MERLTERQEQFISDAQPLYQNLVRDALEGTASKRRAIQAMCLSCCNFNRLEVRQCTVITCPLHLYRPYIKRDDPHSDAVDGDADEQANDAEE